LPLEKSYIFFIISPFSGVGFAHRNGSWTAAPGSVYHDHQHAEGVHSDGDKTLFAGGSVIFDGERKRVVQHAVTLGKRHTMLSDVCRILFRVEFGGYAYNICTLCIFVKTGW